MSSGLDLGELVARVSVDPGPAGRGIRSAQQMLRQGMSDMERDAAAKGKTIGKAAGDSISTSMRVSVKDLGKGLLAGFTVAKVVDGLRSAIGAASDLNETANLTSVVFGQNAKAMDDWASNSDRALALSKQQALAAAGAFGDMFTQLNFSGDQAAGMSRQVLQLAADLGSFKNLKTEDVVDRLSAAFRGEYDSLQALIPNISAARVEQEALSETGKSSATSLTAAEKATATLTIVAKDGKNAIGDLARTQNGAANASKIAAAEAANLRAELGQKLLPAYTALILFGRDKVIPFLEDTVRGFDAAADATRPVTDGIGDVAKTFREMPAPVQSATIALLAFLALRPRVEALGTTLGSKVTDGARSASSALDTVRLNMMYAKDAAAGAESGLAGVTRAIGTAGAAGLRGAASGLLSILGGPWGAAFTGAVAGLTLFISEHEKAKREVEELTAAIEADSGAVGKNTRERVKNALETSGVLKAAADQGLNLQDVTDAALGFADAQQRVNDAIQQQRDLMEDPGLNLSAYADLVGQRRDLVKVEEAIGSKNRAVDEAIGQSKRLAAADGEVTDGMGKLDAASRGATGAVKELTPAQTAAAAASKEAADKLKEQQDATKKAAQAVLDLYGAQLKASGATIDYQDALAGVQERLTKRKELEAELRKTRDPKERARIKDELKEYAAGVDLTTEAGRENQKVLNDLADSARGKAKADLEAGVGLKALRDNMATAHKDFVDNAVRLGVSREAAEKMATQFGLTKTSVDNLAKAADNVPASKQIQIEAETAAARLKLAGLQEAINQLTGKTVHIYTLEHISQARAKGDVATANAMNTANQYATTNAYRIHEAAGGVVPFYGATMARALA